jgi:hypothetical protein
MTDTQTAAHPRTHNLPSLKETLDPAIISALLEIELAPLRERAASLVGSCERFLAAHPTIETVEQDQVAAQILATCARLTAKKSGRLDAARETFKAPVLAAGRQIDAAFPKVAEELGLAADKILRASIAYKQKVEIERRNAAKAEADRLAAEAAIAERMADRGEGSFVEAAETYARAEKAASVLTASAADLTRSRGDAAGTTSLRYKRVVTITSPADVPRMYCIPDPAALARAAGKAGTPIPTIAGVSITDEPDLTVRR